MIPLVADEPTTDLTSALIVIDVANGIGTNLDPAMVLDEHRHHRALHPPAAG